MKGSDFFEIIQLLKFMRLMQHNIKIHLFAKRDEPQRGDIFVEIYII